MKLQRAVFLQSVNTSIGFKYKHEYIKEEVKSSGYLMIGINGKHSKIWDIVLATLTHLTDPECVTNDDGRSMGGLLGGDMG